MSELTIPIDGMSCGHCVAAVRGALEALPGVTVRDVAIGSAAVAYDEKVVTAETIRDAIRDEGYDPRDGGR